MSETPSQGSQPFPGQQPYPQGGQPVPPQGQQPYPPQQGQPPQGHTPQGQPQQGQPYPPAAAPPKKRSVGKVIAIVVGALVGLLALAVFLFFVVLPRLTRPDYESATFHPNGPSNAWLHPGYAEGFDLSPAGSRPLGFSSDQTVGAYYHGGSATLVGRSLKTNEVVWQEEAVTCDINPAMDGQIYCVKPSPTKYEIYRWDIATGEKALIYGAAIVIRGVTPVGVLDGATILKAFDPQGTIVLSFGAQGAINWQMVVPGSPDCYLLGHHVACQTHESFSIIDAATGQVAVDSTPLDGKEVVFLTDGYYTRPGGITLDDIIVTINNFDGSPQSGEVTNPSTPHYPTFYDKFFYPRVDAEQSLSIGSVTADGKVFSAFTGQGDQEIVQWKKRVKSPSIEAVSADGSVAVTVEGDDRGIHTASGRVAEIPGESLFDINVVDGIIVYQGTHDGYQVLIPKG